MFGILKKNLQGIIRRFTGKAEEPPAGVQKLPAQQPAEESPLEIPSASEPPVELKKQPELIRKPAEPPKREAHPAVTKRPEARIERLAPRPEMPEQPSAAQRPEMRRPAETLRPEREHPAQPTVMPAHPAAEKLSEVQPAEIALPRVERPEPPKRSLLDKVRERIATTTLSKEDFSKLFDEMEMALLESSVALEVVERIRADLERQLVGVPLPRGGLERAVRQALSKSVSGLFVQSPGLLQRILTLAEKKKPVVVLFVGVNGSGKTTTVAKVAKLLKERGKSCVLAAADTFRAAAINQLEEHANRIGVRLVKHDYGADPAAVAFDAIRHAEAKDIDVVLIDTSGRMHNKANLMEEMRKILRVTKPDLKVFVGEATTGNDAVEQARAFNDAVDLDGIVLAKADVDEKGGASISVSFVTGKPILALGTGQGYDDLADFDLGHLLDALGLSQ